jgi:hypothetical protein
MTVWFIFFFLRSTYCSLSRTDQRRQPLETTRDLDKDWERIPVDMHAERGRIRIGHTKHELQRTANAGQNGEKADAFYNGSPSGSDSDNIV